MFSRGTLLHSIERGVLVFVAFALTTLMTQNPEWGTITLGSAAAALLHYVAAKLEK